MDGDTDVSLDTLQGVCIIPCAEPENLSEPGEDSDEEPKEMKSRYESKIIE